MNIRYIQRFLLSLLLLLPVGLIAQDWKSEAWSRIDTYRKSELSVTIGSESGDPIDNASVRYHLKRHSFPFGALLRSEVWNTSPYQDIYKQMYLKYFNGAGMEIGLKPKESNGGYWEGQAEIATPWFDENNFIMRGAHLIWEGPNWLPTEALDVYNSASLTNQEKGDSLLGMLDDHLYHAIPKWNIAYWDVINEPVVNDIVNELLPDYNTFVHWFKLVDSLRTVFNKDFGMVLNENNVISGNANWSRFRISDFQAIIDEMLAQGAPIEMLGFQGRIQNGMLSPETMYDRLLMFDKYDLPYQVTEFEIRDNQNYTYTDQQLRQLTEETMTIYFSHPKVTGFWHWTFLDDRDGNLPWALFNYDGSPKPTGEKWIELMKGKFNTDTLLQTNDLGICQIRGFKGEYDIEITYLDSTFTRTLQLDEDTALQIDIPFDLYYTLSGLEDSASYVNDQLIPVDLKAFSTLGEITSIGFFLNTDSIGGSTDSTLSLSLSPEGSQEGWNEVMIKLYDDQGNSFNHSIQVYFGNRLPEIEILTQPEDTIFTGTVGNEIMFRATDPDGTVDSIIVSYAGNGFVYTDTSGVFKYDLDEIPVGEYQFIIEAIDNQGGKAYDTIPFVVSLGANALPNILIVYPKDQAVFTFGSNVGVVILASDPDGNIVSVEVALNDELVYTSNESSFTVSLDTLSVGVHEIVVTATDDRNGQASDAVTITIEQTVSSSNGTIRASEIVIYPNPVSDILQFSQPCDFEIFSIRGVRILKGTGKSRVDLSGLGDGLYIFKTKETIHKIIKE